MDIVRYALLAGLAVVSYLLLLEWQNDYPTTPPEETAQETRTTADSGGGDIPQASTTSPESSGDVPQTASQPSASSASDVPEVEESREQPATPSENLIRVSTDVLNVHIDRRGGDIVHVSLPEYPVEQDRPDEPFVLLDHSSVDNTYVAQSGLIGRDGVDSENRPMYNAESSEYSLSGEQLQVDLMYTDDDGVEVTKRFTFNRSDYLIDVSYEVDNPTDEPWRAALFSQIKRSDHEDPSTGGGLGMASFLGFATTSPEDNYIKIDFDDIADGRPGHEMEGGWMALSQHYFISSWVAPQTRNNFYTRQNNQDQYIGGFTTEPFTVEPGSSSSSRGAEFYAGPKDQYRLAEIAPWLDRTIDYGWLWFIASPIYWLLTQINSVVGNYGWSIVLLTFVVKGIFYKLSATSYRSMANMRRVMPKMNQLKEKYSDDKMKLQKETMELYRKEKINPFGGCLPILVQMPVFIALYWVLLESVELRHAPFMLWISDLSVRDPYFILPLLMGASMFLQFQLNPTPQDPMQAKIMKFMPVMMTVFFLWFPAGLVLYWLTNNILGIAQQWYITRKIENEQGAKA